MLSSRAGQLVGQLVLGSNQSLVQFITILLDCWPFAFDTEIWDMRCPMGRQLILVLMSSGHIDRAPTVQMLCCAR